MAKKSRRTRKQEIEKLQQNQAGQPAAVMVEGAGPSIPVVNKPSLVEVATVPAPRKVVDFGLEYYYVYSELRNITVVAVVMFALMIGLGFFI